MSPNIKAGRNAEGTSTVDFIEQRIKENERREKLKKKSDVGDPQFFFRPPFDLYNPMMWLRERMGMGQQEFGEWMFGEILKQAKGKYPKIMDEKPKEAPNRGRPKKRR